MKRIAVIILALSMLVLCACGSTAPEVTGGNDPVGGATGEPENTTADPTTEPQATAEPTEPEATIPSFSPGKLSVWGVPEPTFAYEYLGYREITKGPDMIPELYYQGSADYDTVRAYAVSLAAAGWNDYVDDCGENSVFAFSGAMGEYKIFIRRDESGNVIIRVRDLSVLAVWDDALGIFVVPEYGEYGSYGENKYDLDRL